ncbi:hypothetical protein OK074_5006 [Actinobacteria bacterium OK074]|nr:hypothetical protein OK074_5006 [Actinobacteria bacterium OK074]
MWPYLAAWADHSRSVTTLALHQHCPEIQLTNEEREFWNDVVRSARRRGELDLVESWYTAAGRLITLARLAEDDASTVIALAGDPDAPGWQVIGQYPDGRTARQEVPSPAPAGVLRPDASRFDRPEPAPAVPLQELIRDVIEACDAGVVSEVLLAVTEHGYGAGPMVRLQELMEAAAQFGRALETVQGRQAAARLAALGRQIGILTREVREVAEDLGATVAVLPPHRTPRPRIRTRPAPDTTPPATPPGFPPLVPHR